VPVAVDVKGRRVRHKYDVLDLNRGKLISSGLQHRRMSYHKKLRLDRTVAQKEPSSAATDLLPDPWIHGPQPGD
jgi:hypothetical protein